MNYKIYKIILILAVCLVLQATIISRSILRPIDIHMPCITTSWLEDSRTYTLRNCYLEPVIFHAFNYDYFMQRLLPKTEEVSYRNHQEKKVVGQVLHDLIEKLVVEIKEHKTSFTDFKVLKKRDFNARTCSGLIIVKFKEYPFVVKLFMETPESFVQPFTKGWQPVCFFMMGGGVNRYLTGFTRFRNLEKIRDCILKDPEWAERIDTPRKWFWIPDTCRWFQMRSKNMGSYDQYRINLPCVYAIIADAVSVDKCFTLFNKNHRQTTMRLTQYLGNRIDPHIDNFMPEKDTNKIIIADTELFAVMVGLKKPLNFTNYKSWYLKLTLKSLQDMLFRSKRYWYNQQQCPQLPLFHEQLHEPESNCGVIKTLD